MDLNLSRSEQVELKRPNLIREDTSSLEVDRNKKVDIRSLKVKACLEPNYVIQNIDKFELSKEDRSSLARILLKYAKQDLLFKLETFMPLCEDTKIKIAQSIARDNEMSVVKYLKILNIQDEQERINLAKLEIGRKCEYIVEFLELFNIQDDKKIIDILNDISVTDKDVSMVFMLNNIYQQNNLKDLNSWASIMTQVLSHICMYDGFAVFLSNIDLMAQHMKQEYHIEYKLGYGPKIDRMIDTLKALGEVYSYTYKEMDKIKDIYIKGFEIDKILGIDNLNKILKIIDNISNEMLQDKLIKITNMLFFVISINKEVVSKNANIVTKVVCELIDLRSEGLKLKLLPYIVRAINEDKLDIIKYEDSKNPKTLACLYFTIFDRYGLYDPDNIWLLDKLRSVVYKSKIKKNAILTQNILDKLISLDNATLTQQERRNVIDFLCENSGDLRQNLMYLHQVISFKEDYKLSKIGPKSKPNALEDVSLFIYGKIGLNNMDLDYLDEFRTCMYNNSDRRLMQYIGLYITKNRHIKEMNAVLEAFVNTIASPKRMQQQRYTTLNNNHLKQLKRLDAKVFEKWVNHYPNKQYVDNREISITDDGVDLFLIGTEIAGSCQNIDAIGGMLNKCLMGYVMDGKNKACVIKDGNGKILARSIIRLLIDRENKLPVLVKEPLYSIANEDIRKTSNGILRQKCLEYANWLGVPLVEKSDGEGKLYPNKLYSMGSNIPYEYVDSARNVCKYGTYEISNMSYVNKNDTNK